MPFQMIVARFAFLIKLNSRQTMRHDFIKTQAAKLFVTDALIALNVILALLSLNFIKDSIILLKFHRPETCRVSPGWAPVLLN